mmetsp:Transcript_22426/g.45008  ORF Transcript_22426/g.45008 Transcript_22426/m.45008 type:complete len:125 (-) Transcript_22426:557-931(-)
MSILQLTLVTTLIMATTSIILKCRHEPGGWGRVIQTQKTRLLVMLGGYATSLCCGLAGVPIVERMLYQREQSSTWYEDSSKTDKINLSVWAALLVLRLLCNLVKKELYIIPVFHVHMCSMFVLN